MNPENYKTKRQGQPKRNSPFSRRKSGMVANTKAAAIKSSPKLREIYNTKTAWVTKA